MKEVGELMTPNFQLLSGTLTPKEAIAQLKANNAFPGLLVK